MKDEHKNFVIFAVIAAFVLFAWQPIVNYFVPSNPAPPVTETGKTADAGPQSASPSDQAKIAQADPTADSPAATRDRKVVLAETPRIPIRTPTLSGSINLKGPRIDDLVLTQYDETIAKDSPPIRLLSPAGAPDAYFAGFGWRGDGIQAPGSDTVWKAAGDTLSPGRPVTLEAANGQGQRFRITISVDDQYMFTVKQTIANAGGSAVQVRPYALVNRDASSADADSWHIHTGPMSVHDDAADYDTDFDDLDEAATHFDTTGGWLGFTDKYWLTALVPDQSNPISAQFRAGRNETYQADYRPAAPDLVQPGATSSYSSRFFAGGKDVSLLQHYQNDAGIAKFDKALDWGWFEIVEKPIFYYLDWLFRMIGNFGVAIILLTLTIRGAMFPIAQRQFRSMAGMRAIQPKMKALQARHKDDKQTLQKEMMQLYKDEKVNPLAGCAPTLLQIPIFYALYKVLILTIEMRHQPFILWIKDLSAPDPLTPVNLFGLLDFTPPGFLHIGIVPILLGISMFFQFRLNPAPMDATQKQIFSIMPWGLMFVMAPFAVGLQIYWITSNLLTITQQQYLYSRHPQLRKQKEEAKAK